MLGGDLLQIAQIRDGPVFVYGFAKSDRANIGAVEEKQFKKATGHVLRLAGKQVEELIRSGDFVELKGDEEKYRSDAMAAIHERIEALHK
jgi:hypothetical protein